MNEAGASAKQTPANLPISPSEESPSLWGGDSMRDKGLRGLKAMQDVATGALVDSSFFVDRLQLSSPSDAGNVVKGIEQLARELGVPMTDLVILSPKRPRKYMKGKRFPELMAILDKQYALDMGDQP